MKKQILAQFNNPDLILLAFMLFLITFVSIIFWTFRKSGRGHYSKMSQAPLSDSKNGGGQ